MAVAATKGPLGTWLPKRPEELTITPTQCAALLERHNARNRPFQKSSIDKCVKALKNGTWRSNGETIILSTKGQVLNGQNRLKAGLISGIPFTSWVMFGIEPDAFTTMDRGKSRNLAQDLSVLQEINATELAASLQIVTAYLQGMRSSSILNSSHDTDVVLKVLEENSGLRDSVAFACSIRRATSRGEGIYCPPRIIAAVHYLIGRPNVSEILQKREQFFDQLLTGEDLHRGNPILTLRNKFHAMSHDETARVKRGMGHIASQTYLWTLVRAWNAFASGESLGRLQLEYIPGTNRQTLTNMPDIECTKQRKKHENVA